ncbi:MAG: protein kinase [Bacteroidetes bacterium]|jgi:predicted Ser/Thr protein kinase|nr:protein kinase [Bacteroidota bacterium]
MQTLVGETIEGYRFVEELGRGGMGTVYRAVDQALDKAVAIKVVNPDRATQGTFRERFRTEARALAKLDSPTIVRVLAFRETSHGMFLVMEYVEGRTLRSVLDATDTLPLAWTLKVFPQVVEAVRQAHERSILHRDLKPGNVLLSDDGQVKVGDFGLAKMQAADPHLTSTYATAGTVCYMAPEQIQGLRHTTAQSDLFSLGVILYEMVAGRLPFDVHTGTYAIQRAIVEEPFPSVQVHRPDAPDALAALIADLTAKDPEQRPASAAVVQQRLTAEVAAPSATRTPLPEIPTVAPDTSFDRSAWLRIGGGVAAVVLLFALTLGGVWYALNGAAPPGDGEAPASRPTASAPAPLPAEEGPANAVTLTVTTTPPGATLRVDGDSMGVTPVELQRPPADQVQLHAAHPLHTASLDTTIALGASRSVQLRFAGLDAVAEAVPAEEGGDDTPTATEDAVDEGTPDPAGDRGGQDATATAPEETAERSTEAPAEEEAAPAAPPVGALRVISTPDSATVWREGAAVGTTPYVASALPAGPQVLTLRLAGYQDEAVEARVVPEEETTVRVSLEPRPARVSLQVLPFGDVLIDGDVQVEATDVAHQDTLPPGTYAIVARYRDLQWARTIRLEPAQEWSKVVDFTARHTVAIIARSTTGERIANAEVLIDGQRQGYTPQQMQLRTGTHTLTVRRQGYQTIETTIVVDDTLPDALTMELTPAP